jgi:phosphoribosylanthranilate isomerase
MNTKVKICGITRSEDAEVAVQEGATALGFIFVRSSPRYIEPDRAKEIIRILPPFVTPVGVLAEASRPEALVLVAKSGIRCLQLHDSKDIQDFSDFPIPCYRVFRASPEFRLESLRGSRAGTFMLDTFVEGALGGTGKTFDWNIAVQAKKYGRVILSGGINPENVGEAVRRVSPYAIDVSSGVERSPGVKDHRKMHLLFEAIAEVGNDRTSKSMVGQ